MRQLKMWFVPVLTMLLILGVVFAVEAGSGSHSTPGIAGNGTATAEFSAAFQKARRGEVLTVNEKTLIDDMTPPDNRRPHDPVDNQGGPDGFGYVFVDNQAGDTATYSWVELQGVPGPTT